MSKEKSLGENRVRVEFNPSSSGIVSEIKQRTAELINLCEKVKLEGGDGRTASLAQIAYEEAAMWAVKSATA